MQFEWSKEKAQANATKHGVTFLEARTVFGDPLSSTTPDPEHSLDEARFLIFGRSVTGRALVVSFTERGESIRLISARSMTPREIRAYEQ
ncbi:MAG: BrnT family toxin [Xanthomonadaceae bacterium]|nr:BrnT family toxin [Xanthomonadaceae bacterium]